MESTGEQAVDLNRLGRSRVYARPDVPGRLFRWHAPRSGRWERLRVLAGTLELEWREGSAIHGESLDAAVCRWFEPGTFWRVTGMGADTRFELEVYAAVRSGRPLFSPVRIALLERAHRVFVGEPAELDALVAGMQAGASCVVNGTFDVHAARATIEMRGRGAISWHPLVVEADQFAAFALRDGNTIDLDGYLRRDHALIESALAGALAGDAGYARWFRNLLERHISIEEDLLFPSYLEAGGRAAWVGSLATEHVRLRRHLDAFNQEADRQALLHLLDSHDEKEERIVYPDILRRIGPDGVLLVRRAMDLIATDGFRCQPR